MSNSSLRFAGQQSYAIHQDRVFLQAELAAEAIPHDMTLGLELRATRTDDPSVCIRLAEMPVTAASAAGGSLIPVQGDAPLALPAGRFSHVLDLVLVANAALGAKDLDCIRFPQPTVFKLPQISGMASAFLQDDNVVIAIPGVFNPRAADTLSGSLSLSLWALPQPYQGGAFAGILLGRLDLGQLPGQDTTAEQMMTASLPPGLEGDWVLTMMLREWTATGDLTRDFQTLPLGIPVHPAAVTGTALPATGETPPVSVSATAPAQAPDAEPVVATGVSINHADVAALTVVKGVGARLATAIVAGRPYATLADLLRVKGMGEKLLARIGGGLSL
ncbi:MAG TPA: helix-hairpin-helix domain-containing protein [Fluviicoccus sp.]|nr:helix-hairpin-helix domain-containing protein [Fluviicoccus sp.]